MSGYLTRADLLRRARRDRSAPPRLSLRGAEQRSNPIFGIRMDCFASLAMTVWVQRASLSGVWVTLAQRNPPFSDDKEAGYGLPGSRTYAGQDRGRIGVAELIVFPFDFETQAVILERHLEHFRDPDVVSRIWKRSAEKRLDGIAQIVKRGLGRRQSDPGELRLEFA